MMNCFQYKIVCQVKQEVLALTNTVQVVTLRNVQNGLYTNSDISNHFIERMKHFQAMLISNHIQPENFDLSQFVTECLRNADIHLNHYINSCASETKGE
uniref:Type III secretion system protein n=1 Tax=Caenorhabditis tropicalis TaxID=1561998 RepID=A0A1I7TT21_9PELO